MNSVHDLGGMMGFGPVHPENDEPVFHAEWEKRAFALTLGVGATGLWNLDITRHTRESLAPVRYLSSSYYQIWIAAMTELILRYGLASKGEIESGRMLDPPRPVKGKLEPGTVAKLSRSPSASFRRPARNQAAFSTGDRVRAKNLHPLGHTRLPRYVRNHVGEIVRLHGTFVFPDSNAHGKGEDPQWVYCVRFGAHELWGHETKDSVHLDLWEPYLERA